MKKATENNMSITVIGTIYLDIKGYPEGVFDPRGRNAGSIIEFHGGVGRNIAEDIGSIGLKPRFISLADPGGSGDAIIKRLEAHNVDTSLIKRTDDGMGTWLAIFDDNGDVYANLSRRPDLSPILDILKEHSDEVFTGSDGILLEIDMGTGIADYVFEQAQAHSVKIYGVISNMNIALEMKNNILKTDCFICNQQEAGIFFDKPLEDLSAEEMLAVLPGLVSRSGLKRMIVTMGSKGSVYAETGGMCGICPPETVEVRDTTGAGDAFFAGTAVALSLGKTIKEAAGVGTRMAAAVVAREENVCPPLSIPGISL